MDAMGLSWITRRGIYLPANSAFPDRAPTATWAQSLSATFTPGQAPGPDQRSGPTASMAWGITETSGNTAGTPNVISDTTFSASTALWRLTYFIKPYGPAKRFAAVYFENVAVTNFAGVVVDLAQGLIVDQSSIGGSYNIVRSELARYPNNWFKVYQYSNLAAETGKVEVDLSDSLVDITTNAPYSADGLSGFLLWGIDIRLATDATG